MQERWIISDMHFGHKNIVRFKDKYGDYVRGGFNDYENDGIYREFNEDIEKHDETLVKRWNDRVSPSHRVYVLGDIGKSRSDNPLTKSTDIIKRLNGRKVLTLGNHDDIHDMHDLASVFEEITFWRVYNKGEMGLPHDIMMTHAPLHANERSPAPRRICVHGHIHEKLIRNTKGFVDPWYINVCVEHTNHAPLHWDDFLKRVKNSVRRIEKERDEK